MTCVYRAFQFRICFGAASEPQMTAKVYFRPSSSEHGRQARGKGGKKQPYTSHEAADSTRVPAYKVDCWHTT